MIGIPELKVEDDLRLLRQILALLPLGVVVEDAQRRIVYVNETFTRETGYTLSEVAGRSCNLLQGPDTDPEDIKAIREALNEAVPVQRTLVNYRKDGRKLLYRVNITPIFQDGALRYFIGIQEDVTLLNQAQLALERAALTDGLTGLGNRRAFDVKLDQNQELGESFALMVADLDNLKQVNDRQGHIAGDRLIQRVAQALAELCGPEDQAFRLGGDEFVVLTGSMDSGSLTVRLTEWRRALSQLQQTLSLSTGVAIFPDDHDDVWEVFREADRRMYVNKARLR